MILSVLNSFDNIVIARDWIRRFNFYSQGQRMDQESGNSRVEELHPSLQRRP